MEAFVRNLHPTSLTGNTVQREAAFPQTRSCTPFAPSLVAQLAQQ